MEDKTHEDHLDNPTNNQSENTPDLIIPCNGTENINRVQQNENMEVHHHAHHEGKKNWKSYFWEFLMLFLAVFCGFLAEYQLEHKIERDREIQYIRSIHNDLKTDITKLNNNLIIFEKIFSMQGIVIETLPTLEKGFNHSYYYNSQAFKGFPDFIYTDATIQQLKNSGGFRLIRNNKVVDSIMSYDAIVKVALINEGALGRVLDKTDEYNNEIFNSSYLLSQINKGFTPEQLEIERFDYLLTHDKIILFRYANHLLYHRNVLKITSENMKRVKLTAERLLIFLKKEYDIE